MDVIETTDGNNANSTLEVLIPEKFNTIPELTDDEIVDSIVNRVLAQNNGTPEFKKWVRTFTKGHDKSIGSKVYHKINTIAIAYRNKYALEVNTKYYFQKTSDPNITHTHL